jgi:hypothetical protein
VFCNYNPQVEELLPRGTWALQEDGQKKLHRIVVPSAPSPQSCELGWTSWHLDSFQRFKARTAVSIGFLGFTEAFSKDFFGLIVQVRLSVPALVKSLLTFVLIASFSNATCRWHYFDTRSVLVRLSISPFSHRFSSAWFAICC